MHVYNGKPGNRLSTEDGWLYRGRGYIQLTGRDNYVNIGLIAGLDLVGNSDLVVDPSYALACAGAFWQRVHYNEAADNNSVFDVTKRVTGSLQELSNRTSATDMWRDELGVGR